MLAGGEEVGGDGRGLNHALQTAGLVRRLLAGDVLMELPRPRHPLPRQHHVARHVAEFELYQLLVQLAAGVTEGSGGTAATRM